MKEKSWGFGFSGILLIVILQWSSAVMALESPRKDVEAITRNLLELFEKNIKVYKKDSSAFVSEVGRQLSPVVAFDSIARGVMGKYAHKSDQALIDKFSSVFKESLISFYGKALLKLDDSTLKIDNIEEVPDKTLKEYEAGKLRLIPVNMTVKTSTRRVAISYSMVHVDGRWKLRNIIVDGINIGKQFRNQFAAAVDTHGKVDYVVNHWLKIMGSEKQSDKKSKKKSDKKS